MAVEEKDDKPTVYLVSETPNTLDKPVFDFSKVSYTEGRAIGAVHTRIQQKKKEIQAALEADGIEALFKQFDALTKEQDAHTAKHGQANKMLAIRLQRLEQRIEGWQEPDLDKLQAECDALENQQETNVLAGVTYVPQVWLVAGAPMASKIDWSDYQSLKYLRGDKFRALIQARADAQNDSPS